MKKDFLGLVIFIVLSVIILVFSALIDFSFFHAMADLATIFLGLIIFIIASYSKEYSKGSNLLFVGVAYLSISTIDLMHLVNDGGFNQSQIDINAATQLWIGARFTEAFVLYFAYSKLLKKHNMNPKILFASFGFTTLFIFIIVALQSFLPIMYDIESGYTLYKKVLDVLIILLFILAAYTINKNESRKFNKNVLLIAIGLKILSETVYIFNPGDQHLFELLRYLFKYTSYVMLFMVFARDLLVRPYENIFRAFKDKEEELLDLSRKDSLTGLYNHSTSYQITKEIIKENEIKKEDICLMMIDIDNFKCINDKYGHVKGDEILLQISNIFKNCDGPLKLAGRYGGDEFVVLFTDCNGETAKKIAENIFVKMEELSEIVEIKVTLSIGIAEWKTGFSAKDLVKSADYQMYEAKLVGKKYL